MHQTDLETCVRIKKLHCALKERDLSHVLLALVQFDEEIRPSAEFRDEFVYPGDVTLGYSYRRYESALRDAIECHHRYCST